MKSKVCLKYFVHGCSSVSFETKFSKPLKIVVLLIKTLRRFEMFQMLILMLPCGQFSNVEEKNQKYKDFVLLKWC